MWPQSWPGSRTESDIELPRRLFAEISLEERNVDFVEVIESGARGGGGGGDSAGTGTGECKNVR